MQRRNSQCVRLQQAGHKKRAALQSLQQILCRGAKPDGLQELGFLEAVLLRQGVEIGGRLTDEVGDDSLDAVEAPLKRQRVEAPAAFQRRLC